MHPASASLLLQIKRIHSLNCVLCQHHEAGVLASALYMLRVVQERKQLRAVWVLYQFPLTVSLIQLPSLISRSTQYLSFASNNASSSVGIRSSVTVPLCFQTQFTDLFKSKTGYSARTIGAPPTVSTHHRSSRNTIRPQYQFRPPPRSPFR